MRSRSSLATVAVLAVLLVTCGPPQETERATVGTTTGSNGGDYDDLVTLFEEFRELHAPALVNGVPDYSSATMARIYEELRVQQRRLGSFDVSHWSISEQIDYHLVRAEMNGMEFTHRVMRPSETSPFHYWGSSTGTSTPYFAFSDRPAVPEGPGWGELGFSGTPDFPLSDDEVEAYRVRLQALPQVLAQGKANIIVAEAKRDLGLIVLRAIAEEGSLLEPMVAQMQQHHPDLVADTEAAWAAVQSYGAWVEDNLDAMQAPVGFGKENFNWWLKNVWLVPYTWDEAWTLGHRERRRGITTLKLEQYRNRDLPQLEPAQTKEEYLRRHHTAEDQLRRFLLGGAFMTVSADELAAAYAAYPPRPPASPPARPRNFLAGIIHEHLGHQLDALRPETDLSPIRAARRLHEMTHPRREGVADGLGQAMMHAGILDDEPRVREQIHFATGNRGGRALGSLRFWANELDYEGWNRYDAEMSLSGSSMLDESEWWNAAANYNTWDHKKDAVRGPGYEMAYNTGVLQFQTLVADRALQLGIDFDMREFMDELFAAGQMPMALIRWQMTGLTDEMDKLLDGGD
ncbi:MAG TPA: hypothetical protein QGG47_11845 [Acidobacteriota bacterium]|nr:hypothetical protein [Acidobacteriota bacterium]